jgi:hypothetical protein
VIYNSFWIPGKIPSFNELVDWKSIGKKPTSGIILMRGKKKGSYQFNRYNEVKQNWKAKTCSEVIEQGFQVVLSSYFTYLFVEKTRKRDPSNFCAAGIKFVEDGLILAGCMPNDGWDNVLGISQFWMHDKEHQQGILVAMASEPLTTYQMMLELDKKNVRPEEE